MLDGQKIVKTQAMEQAILLYIIVYGISKTYASRKDGSINNLIVSSPSFENGGLIPIAYTGYGKDISPELRLTGLTTEAVSLAIIMDDMGHPIPQYNHWVIWNIPVMPVIPEGIPYGSKLETLEGAIQDIGYGKHRYRGPKPPFNWSHIYYFNIYALSCQLDLPAHTRKRRLLKAMEGHILQHGLLIGHYR